MKFTRIILLAGTLLCSVYAPLHAQYLGGSGNGYASVTSEKIVLAIEDIPALGSVPEAFKLYQNYPNPFNPTTNIGFTVPKAANVSLTIYNSNGQLVRTLISNNRVAGYHTIQWDAKNETGTKVAGGMYFYRIIAGSFVQTRKMTLIK
jgi:hypothetical protein